MREVSYKPFLSCMSWDDLALLDAALYYNHHRHIVRPREPDIMDFNPAAEMSKLPESEDHMRK